MMISHMMTDKARLHRLAEQVAQGEAANKAEFRRLNKPHAGCLALQHQAITAPVIQTSGGR